jgi:hypothetical protein
MAGYRLGKSVDVILRKLPEVACQEMKETLRMDSSPSPFWATRKRQRSDHKNEPFFRKGPARRIKQHYLAEKRKAESTRLLSMITNNA